MRKELAALRRHAGGYPEAREDLPWGELVVKVGRKIFVFFGRDEANVSLSVKLPGSASLAFDLPYVTPTGYGLGRSGWVTARFGPKDPVPVEMLKKWIDESYRAVAPKRLVAQLDAARAPLAEGPPDEAALKARLGPAWPAYRAALARFGGLSGEWKRYSRKSGWTLRLARGERPIAHLTPQDGAVKATVLLGKKAVAAAKAAKLRPGLRQAIAGARTYVEGTPVAVELRRVADLADLETLVALKG